MNFFRIHIKDFVLLLFGSKNSARKKEDESLEIEKVKSSVIMNVDDMSLAMNHNNKKKIQYLPTLKVRNQEVTQWLKLNKIKYDPDKFIQEIEDVEDLMILKSKDVVKDIFPDMKKVDMHKIVDAVEKMTLSVRKFIVHQKK